MSTYRIPDSVTKKVESINSANSLKEKASELNAKLDSVISKYEGANANSLADKVSLERKKFSKPTEDEIKQNSETLLADYKNTGINNIEKEYKSKEDELYSNKQTLMDDTTSNKSKLDSYYDQAKTNAENQALKRGLARSSIVINQLDAFDSDKINDYKALDEQLSNQINAINFELNALKTKKKSALNDFNISYAVKVQEKINELTKQLDEKESEVIKYNNEIALKEAEFNKKVDEMKNELSQSNWEDTKDIIKIYGEYGQNVLNKVKNEDIYNTAKSYLDNLTKEEAKQLLQDESFKRKIGDTNYEKLLAIYG